MRVKFPFLHNILDTLLKQHYPVETSIINVILFIQPIIDNAFNVVENNIVVMFKYFRKGEFYHYG